MQNITPTLRSPRNESLQFIRAFARLYSPYKENEAEARRMAHALAYGTTANC